MNPIKVKYSNNYDIISLHSKVLETLSKESQEYVSLTKELEALEKKLLSFGSMAELKQLNINKMYLVSKLKECNKETLLSKYLSESESYLIEYGKIPTTVAVVDVMSFDHMKISPADQKREKIVDAYISIAGKYFKLDVTKVVRTSMDNICSNCHLDLVGIKTSSSGIKICSCGAENEVAKPVIIAPKEYLVWGNFLKTFKRNIGDIKVKIIDLITSDLDAQAEMDGKPTGEYYRSLPLDKYGFKKGTSVSLLCSKLSQLGYAEYYKSYAYIGHKQYGWALRTYLKSRIDELESNFKAKQDVWDSMSPDAKEGNSSISNPYRLCREYQHLGVKCRLRDFNVSDKRETIEKYDRVYKKMCIGAGFKFPHYENISSSEEDSSIDSE